MTIDVDAPLNAITRATAQAVTEDPANALAVFRASGVAESAVATVVRARTHTVRVDEPAALGGADTAANPVEVYLAALIACQVVTYRFVAQQRGIVVEDLRIDAEGDLDVRGFFGLDESVRPGFQAVRLTVHVQGPESAERYAELQREVESRCPVLDLTTAPTPVQTTLVTG
ncbi:OsmC family protein [Nocardia macrotermitis]|uniref:OsmC-like protein n=1 Tax=Nocardia macrotermitis TaxID=2585198 RepID=A0A7K0D6G4_9NOCA|nr:OsmC family protein [Nocardia macrotermitis]MQY20424.1 hypothetical protein [Nocardia macrotermitis]